jgi:peptidoglycan/LPS O-acetylase OafA/YrhL
MVFLEHAMSRGYRLLPLEGTVLGKFLYTISDGPTGVSIFFTLSGFLITYLLIAEHKEYLHISLKSFYLRRVLRIWPLYFLVVAAAFLYPVFNHTNYGANILYHLSFLTNFDAIRNAGDGVVFQNITWSVAIEEQFYVFWPLIFVFLPQRWWLHAIIAVIGSSIGFRVVNADNELLVYFHTVSVLMDLGIGALMACLTHQFTRLRNYFEQCTTKHHLFFFLFAACMMFGGDILFPFKYGQIVAHTLGCVSFALIICAQALSQTRSVLELQHLSVLNSLGKYTYCIYLIHPLCIVFADKMLSYLYLPVGFIAVLLSAFLSFTITIIASKLSYKFYESRFLDLKKRAAQPKTGPTVFPQTARI